MKTLKKVSELTLFVIVSAALFLNCIGQADYYCDGIEAPDEESILLICSLSNLNYTPRRLASESEADYNIRVQNALNSKDRSLALCAFQIQQRDKCLKENKGPGIIW